MSVSVRTVGISLASFLALLGIMHLLNGGDTFYDYRLSLTCDKATYRIGDDVVLRLNVVPRGPDSFSLSEELHRNITIVGLVRPKTTAPNVGKRVRYVVTPDEPFTFAITGTIYRVVAGGIMLDFREFGITKAGPQVVPRLSFGIYPYRAPIIDSAEWSGSNEIEIKIVE